MVEQPTLPLARHSDPDTSHEAARRARPRASQRRGEILGCFLVYGPMTDDELVHRMPWVKDSTLKSARSRIAGDGDLVALSDRRLSDAGVPMTVWAIPDVS